METYFLRDEDLFRLYERIAGDFELYVPLRVKSASKSECDCSFIFPTDDYIFKKYSQVDKKEIVFNDYRAVEPARSFFTYAKEEVCEYFDGDSTRQDKTKPVAMCGIKNCDLFSLKIQDFVFLGGDEEDSIYKVRRENALIISSDCPSFKEACFCRAFDINPHAEEGFDFNLSPIDEGYLADVGSDKAKKMTGKFKDIFTPAAASQLRDRSTKRAHVIKEMEGHLYHHKIPKKEVLKEIVLAGYESKVWQDEMLTCVECGGCVFACDTCHCFLLADSKSGAACKRTRIWDGCLYKNFTRVAGGANPLKMRYMRLRNRFLKKFDFFIDNIGFQACCGCGRCIDVCPGKIDIRRILRRLHDEKYLPTH